MKGYLEKLREVVSQVQPPELNHFDGGLVKEIDEFTCPEAVKQQAAIFAIYAGGRVATQMVGSPFDVLKTRMQTTKQTVEAKPLTYSRIARHVYNAEDMDGKKIKGGKPGIRNFYRGNIASLTRMCVTQGAKGLLTVDLAKQIEGSLDERVVDSYPLLSFMLSSMFIASLDTVVSCPFENDKVRTQTEKNRTTIGERMELRFQKGFTHGTQRLYRAAVPMWLDKMFLGAGFYAGYEAVNHLVQNYHGDKDHKLTWGEEFASSLTIGTFLSGARMPIAVTRSTMMYCDSPHKKLIPTMEFLYKEGGLGRFYKGFLPSAVNCVLGTLACQLMVDYARHINKMDVPHSHVEKLEAEGPAEDAITR